MSIRRSALAAAICATLLSLLPRASAQQVTGFGEIMEVNLTSVDFVAVDKAGHPVAGLKASDFEVYEEGQKQEITHFSESGKTGTSAVILAEDGSQRAIPSPWIARKFIFYFDDATLTQGNRQIVFPSVRKFIASELRDGDQAMIVTWNRALKVQAPWTSDRAALDAAVQSLAGQLASASQMQAEKQRAERLLRKMSEELYDSDKTMRTQWSELENAANSYAEAHKHDVSQSTAALARLLASLAGVDGRKVLVIATESLPTLAGADVFEQLENIRQAALSSGDPGLMKEARAGSRVSAMSRFNVAPMLEVLARAANAAGVTVYGINPKGLAGPASGTSDQQMYREVNEEFARSDQVLAGIKMLAGRTGGTAMIGLPADAALERVGRDLDAAYSLGYRSKAGASPDRKIEVRSKVEGIQVRSRTNVYYRTLEREMADRVIANHLQSRPANDLGISLQADPVTADGSRRLLPVRVIIPMDMLTFIPDGKGGVAAGFSVFTCSGDGAGSTSGVNVQSQAINFTPEQAAQMKGRRVGFAIQVPMENGRYGVSVGVVDHGSLTQGFATIKGAP